MNRTQVASVQKIFPTIALAGLLFCNPLFAAPEGETRATGQASVMAWFVDLWGDINTWLAAGSAPIAAQPEEPTNNLDNGCAIDPHGGCRG